MGFRPETQQSIYESIRDRIRGTIPGLTNFTDTSFNYVWTQGFASEFREKELDKTATYLSGLVEYAGGPISEEDLNRLGISDVADVDELNERLNDVDLEELVKIVGIERDSGTEARGTVTFTTQSGSTTIPAGTIVGTQPTAQGEFLEYRTVEEVTAGDGTTIVTADIVADEVGTEYNVGADTITYLPNPPTGVQSVTNNQATSDGEDEESNDELRERAKNAIFSSSGGGTVQGLEGFVETNVDGVTDARVEEFFTGDSWHGSYPHGHVIVDGGIEAEVLDAIESARPVSVEHVLVRPDTFDIAVAIDVTGDNIEKSAIRDNVSAYLDSLEIGDDVIYNRIIERIMSADNNIIDTQSAGLSVEFEEHFFNQEEIDDFENNDTTILNRNWDGWTGDTANFNAQSGTTIGGSYSGELASSNESVSVTATKASGDTIRSFEAEVQIDTQSGNASDTVSLSFESSGTSLGSVDFAGDGSVSFNGTSITTWTAGSSALVTIQWDFANDQADITVSGTTVTDIALSNSVSNWTNVSFSNDTTTSGSTVNAYIDNVFSLETRYPLGLGDEMVADGITDVSGTFNDSPHTFTEDSDYREYASGSGDDSIEWILSGDRPDINMGNTTTFEYSDSQDVYRIDAALTDEGVQSVEDAGGTVYQEGTDWEELDISNDDRDDSIEWLGNSTPNDGAEITVTYFSSTRATIDYDINDADISLSLSEKADSGSISVTVL